jgi:Electron transfer DM13
MDELARTFFGALYDYRLLVAVLSAVAVAALAGIAVRRGWLGAARRHPGRAGVVIAVALVVGLPLTWYLASPIFLRSSLVEAEDAVVTPTVVPTPIPSAATPTPSIDPGSSGSPTPAATPEPTPVATPTPFAPTTVASGTFQGSDDFHFGSGTARIIETKPGRYRLRFDDFSVRNGPDLYVYLSPSADGYADGALELGKLKATDGAFGYDLPDGADPAGFASAIIWCKQFSHLFATAPLDPAG